MRHDGRKANELRPISIEPGYQKYPDGSVLIGCGDTKVICSVFASGGVPSFLVGSGRGWVTAEYAMLPGAGQSRTRREPGTNGRSQEIQRLIGRSLRAVTRLDALGEQTLHVDCDVLQADGGTRTAAITGSFVALALALRRQVEMGLCDARPLLDSVQAVSVGMIDGVVWSDLCYEEDVRAEVDMNIVMTGSGRLVEVQGTAERAPFDQAQLSEMLGLASQASVRLLAAQRAVLGDSLDALLARHA